MKTMFRWMIAGGVIALVGVVILLCGLSLNGWRWKNEYETLSFTAENTTEELHIEIGAGNAHIRFYDGERVQIDYPVSDWYRYTVREESGTVTLQHERLSWFNFAFYNLPETEIRIPADCALNLTLTVSAGTVNVGDGTLGDVSIDVSAGTLNVGALSCRSLKCDLSAGSANLDAVACTQADFDLSAGSLSLNRLTCSDVKIDVSAGSATLGIAGKEEDYSVSVDRSAGSCNLASAYRADAAGRLEIDLSAGSVSVRFTD